MRLTCPNCDAQYEVDDKAIPESGRDVQCSNCGHAWFQLPPDVEAQLRDEAQTFGDAGEEAEVKEPQAEAEPEAPEPEAEAPEAEAEPEPEAEAEPEDEAKAEPEAPEAPEPEAAEPDEAAPEEEAPATPPRRELDEGLKSLLREEADHEMAARKAEGSTLETQPDLGLDAAAASTPSPEATKARIERLIAEEGDDDEGESLPGAASEVVDGDAEEIAPVAGARRDLLPDIDEINSTLRANSERGRDEPGASADAETPAEARRGFRRGFLMVLALVFLAVVVYLYGPRMAQRFPAAAGPLNAYVQTVDKGRVWLNGLMEKATSAITGKSAPDEGGEGSGG